MKNHVHIFLFIICLFSLGANNQLFGQTPTVQDCLGAIPICQNVYVEPSPYAYSGNGNFTFEILAFLPCYTIENNGVWYSFSPQTPGNFSFELTPQNPNDDYDWILFDMTSGSCSQLSTTAVSTLMVSSNNYGTFGFNGPTGASTAQGGIGNCNGPGAFNGPIWNADVPVTVGNTYILYVSNWSNSTFGYTLDFSGSSASIFDNVPPTMDTILTPFDCVANLDSLEVEFSENLLCTSVQPLDFTLTGPGGPYTITSATGVGCASGTAENTFVLHFTPNLAAAGTYYLNLVAGSGSVEDLCGNLAVPTILSFTVPEPVVVNSVGTPASCFGVCDGTVGTGAMGGAGSFTYLWSGGLGTTDTVTGICAGIYYVTATDSNGCAGVDTIEVLEPPLLVINSISIGATSCFGSGCDGNAVMGASGGTPPYSYLWGNGSNLPTNNVLCAGSEPVQVIDANGCVDLTAIVVPEPSEIVSTINGAATICISNSTPIWSSSIGGTAPYQYAWSSGASTDTAYVDPTVTTTYKVTTSDVNGCVGDTLSVEITVLEPLSVTTTAAPDTICPGEESTISAAASGGDSIYSFTWNNGAGVGSASIVSPTQSTWYQVSVTDLCGTSPAAIDSVYVQVGGYPRIRAGTSGDDTICRGDSVMFVAGAGGGVGGPLAFTYQWDKNLGMGHRKIVKPVKTTTYTVTVTDLCLTEPGIATITVNVGEYPGASFDATVREGCTPVETEFRLRSDFVEGSLYEWDLGNFQWQRYDNLKIANRYETAGCYDVALKVTTPYGCVSSYSVDCYIDALPNPVADFNFSEGATSLNRTVEFQNLSVGSTSIEWSLGDGFFSTEDRFAYTYPEESIYEIELIAENEDGCLDTLIKPLDVAWESTLYIPTAFTPNGDGLNDLFGPVGEILPEGYSMLIFDRWGHVVFQSNAVTKKWNGRSKNTGQKAPIGVYAYLIQCRNSKKEIVEVKGSVVLVRNKV